MARSLNNGNIPTRECRYFQNEINTRTAVDNRLLELDQL